MNKLLEKAINQLKQLPLAEQEKIAQSILEAINNEQQENFLPGNNKTKLSESLLLPELEEGEDTIFTRDQDTGRDITL